MKTNSLNWLACAGFAFAAATLLSWKRTDHLSAPQTCITQDYADTTPILKRSYDKKEYKIGDLDQAM
ncbi:MAG: hypothetical protein ABIS69_02235, partial [Sediminibacterium sp.]